MFICIIIYTHTHTHAHTHIYLYIYIMFLYLHTYNVYIYTYIIYTYTYICIAVIGEGGKEGGGEGGTRTSHEQFQPGVRHRRAGEVEGHELRGIVCDGGQPRIVHLQAARETKHQQPFAFPEKHAFKTALGQAHTPSKVERHYRMKVPCKGDYQLVGVGVGGGIGAGTAAAVGNRLSFVGKVDCNGNGHAARTFPLPANIRHGQQMRRAIKPA
jgi:hypothetical protein